MESDDVMKLNEKTTIPFIWIAVSIPFLVSGIFWLTILYENEQANAKAITRLEQRVDAQYSLLLDIHDRVIHLESWQKDKK